MIEMIHDHAVEFINCLEWRSDKFRFLLSTGRFGQVPRKEGVSVTGGHNPRVSSIEQFISQLIVIMESV